MATKIQIKAFTPPSEQSNFSDKIKIRPLSFASLKFLPVKLINTMDRTKQFYRLK